jgi:hypothetical protein
MSARRPGDSLSARALPPFKPPCRVKTGVNALSRAAEASAGALKTKFWMMTNSIRLA